MQRVTEIQIGYKEQERNNCMLEQVKGIIFDLDGTLVDSMWVWREIDEEFLGPYGIEIPDDLQKKIEGMSFTETAQYFKKAFQLPMSVEELKKLWNRMAYEKYSLEVPLKDGVLEFLRYLKEEDMKVGIATSNSKELLMAALESLGIKDYFQVVLTGCEVGRGKPFPDIYLQVAKKLQVSPEECLVFEDLPAGILAGKSAGMRVCAIKDTFSNHMISEKKQLADYYIDSYHDILTNNYEVLK